MTGPGPAAAVAAHARVAAVEAHAAPSPDGWPRQVTTTIEPGRVIMVTRGEWLDLKRSGILLDEGAGRTNQKPGPSATARDRKD